MGVTEQLRLSNHCTPSTSFNVPPSLAALANLSLAILLTELGCNTGDTRKTASLNSRLEAWEHAQIMFVSITIEFFPQRLAGEKPHIT